MVHHILEGDRGQLWLGTMNGLNLFDPESENISPFLPSANITMVRYGFEVK
jgi:ligand-binding sensor domain-containing protein